KNTLTQGSRTFTRLKPVEDAISETQVGTKREYNVNYSGLKVKYTIAKSNNNRLMLVARIHNINTDVTGTISFISDGIQLMEQDVNPGEVVTTKIPAEDFSVKVIFKKSPESIKSNYDLIEWLKKVTEDNVTIKGNELIGPSIITGVRG